MSGESEEQIRFLFDQAMSSAPCIIFIDEIDAITPKRETAQREMERRIVAQLLSCMDGNLFLKLMKAILFQLLFFFNKILGKMTKVLQF